MDEYNQKILQKMVGKFLYYARSIYPTMLMALNSLEAVQTPPTIETAKQITQFLNYSATHPDAIIEYRKSEIIICVYSDASYISEPEARSRAGGYFLLGPNSKTPIQDMPLENGPVRVECSIVRNVVASSTEAELGGLFQNCHKSTYMRTALSDMSHIQPPTPVETENTATNGIVNITAKQKDLLQ